MFGDFKFQVVIRFLEFNHERHDAFVRPVQFFTKLIYQGIRPESSSIAGNGLITYLS